MAHPNVKESCVVGIPHPKWQERPLALVVTKNGEKLSRNEIEKLLQDRFASWQYPDQILFVDEIPKPLTKPANIFAQ